MQQRKKGLSYFIKGEELKDIEEEENPTYTVPTNRDAAFVEPHWAGLPKPSSGNSVYLEVWKGSAVIARHNISTQSAWVIGRHPQYAHIHSYHESISRQHVAIVHCVKKTVWYCIDLKSFHGTFVDGKRLEPWKPTLLSEGAKLTLGGSSRAYSIKVNKEGLEKEEQVEEPPLKKLKTSQPEKVDKKRKSNNKDSTKVKEKEDDIEVHCSHLLVKHAGSRRPSSWRSENITRTKEEAIRLVEDYRSKIISGQKNFADLAKKYSDCESAKNGGDLKPFKRGKMQPPFEKAAFALKVGEVSGIVESDSGVHIILRHQ